MPCGGVRLKLEWGAPHAGSGTDEFTLVTPDELHVTSKLSLEGGVEGGFHAVYCRKR